MKIRLKPLQQQTLVITGASSGIGLASARAAVAAGARVVLVARNEAALEQVEHALAAGDRVLTVAADVGRREDLERVARDTIARFGGFDSWINNAGASVWGRLEDVDDADHYRVMQTNFWGTLYGSTIALAHLRDKGGAILNVGSVESAVAAPLHASYAASKHAIKALTDSLRSETQQARLPVSISLIRPSSTDTLFVEHAKTYLGEAPSLPPPRYAPEVVARAILHACEHPQRDVYIGNAKLITRLGQNAPKLTDWLRRRVIYNLLGSGRPAEHPEGALHNAEVGHVVDGQISSGHARAVLRGSLYNRASRHPLLTAALLLGAAALLGAIRRRSP